MIKESKMVGRGLRGLVVTLPSGEVWDEEKEKEEFGISPPKDYIPQTGIFKKEQK